MVLATVQQHTLDLGVAHILLREKCVPRQVVDQALRFFSLAVALAHHDNVAVQREFQRVDMP